MFGLQSCYIRIQAVILILLNTFPYCEILQLYSTEACEIYRVQLQLFSQPEFVGGLTGAWMVFYLLIPLPGPGSKDDNSCAKNSDPVQQSYI